MSVLDTRETGMDLRAGSTRALALAGGLVLTASYLSVLRDVTDVVGGTPLLAAVTLVALGLATLLAIAVPERVAAVLATGLVAFGAAVYMEAAPLGWQLLGDLGKVVVDTMALLTGISVLRMQAVGAWALGFGPAPVFLSWYLLVRRRYALGVAAGGLALLLFVLTGDAGTTVTLVGVVGGALAVGFGELEHRGLSMTDLEVLALVLSVMVVLTTTVTVIPVGSGGSSFFPGSGTPSVEGNVVGAGERLDVVGSVSLSPEVRFVVESNRADYWRVGAYDRYTGQGWVRTGKPSPYDEDELRQGPGSSQRVVQEVSVRSKMSAIPAAWRPTSLDGDAEDGARITSIGGLQTAGRLSKGDEYTVVSRGPSPSQSALRAAGDDYPDELEDRYTQLPGDMPDRLDTFTDRLTDGARGPYESANRIQSWLKSNKNYSLDVDRPDDDIASSFVFEMDAGYCTYFATAMVAMLRTQDIPARMTVGYTTGQRVDEDRWVVRGLNAHAWVEVYFDDLGWIRFDPTPASPRQDAERNRVEQARQNGNENVDTADSDEGTWTPEETPTATPGPGGPTTTATATPGGNGTTPQGSPGGPGGTFGITPVNGDNGGGPDGPSKEVLALGLVVAVGLAAGVRRSRAIPRLRRWAGTYWQRRTDDPDRDVRRAVERLECALARQHRERQTGETRGSYLTTLAAFERDERLARIGHVYELAVYGGGVDRATADEAVDLVDEAVRDHAPLLSRRGS
jgi:transglutaminase-like putative cysteine protease